MSDKKKIWLIHPTEFSKDFLNLIKSQLNCVINFSSPYSTVTEDSDNVNSADGLVLFTYENKFTIDINEYAKYTRDQINIAVAQNIPIFLVYTTKSGQTNIYTTSFRNSIISGISGTTDQFSKLKSRTIKEPEKMKKEYHNIYDLVDETSIPLPPDDAKWDEYPFYRPTKLSLRRRKRKK